MIEENILTPAKGNTSYLIETTLVAGDVLRWLESYREEFRFQKPLKTYLQERLSEWLQNVTSSEDRDLLKELFSTYGFPIEGPDVAKSDVKGEKIWSAQEIGFLSPRIPRPKEKIIEPKPEKAIAFLDDGSQIEYVPQELPGEWKIEEEIFRVVGEAEDKRLVLKNPEGRVELLAPDEFNKIQKQTHTEELIDLLLDPATSEKALQTILTQVPHRNQHWIKGNLSSLIKRGDRQALQKYFLGETK